MPQAQDALAGGARKERFWVIALATAACALHGLVDLALTPPEVWAHVIGHRALWVLVFLGGLWVTRHGRPPAVDTVPSVLGLASVLFTLPLVQYTGLAASPMLVWFCVYPALAACLAPTDTRAVGVTSAAAVSVLACMFVFTPHPGLAPLVIAGTLTAGLSTLASIRAASRQRCDASANLDLVTRAQGLATVGTLSAGVAHDMSNYAQSLEWSLACADDDLEALDCARDAARHMSELARELRDASRPRTAGPASVHTCVESAIKLSRGAFFGHELQIALPPTAPLVHADSGHLVQILVNLIHNAADAMPQHGVIRVWAKESGGRLVLGVDDSGPGVPEAEREAIFDPFMTTKGSKGTGLGLTMCRRYALEFGGELKVDAAPTGGARFTVTLLPVRALERVSPHH